jgi:hypothetical protein
MTLLNIVEYWSNGVLEYRRDGIRIFGLHLVTFSSKNREEIKTAGSCQNPRN